MATYSLEQVMSAPNRKTYSLDEVVGPTPDDGFSFSEMASNIIPSAKGVASDMVQPFISPVSTAKAVGNTVLGAVQKLIPGEQESEKYADAVGQMIMDRYGSVDKALQTLETDPVGVLLDVSGVLTAGGSTAARAPGMVGKAGRAAQQTGLAVDPVNLASNSLKPLISRLTPYKKPAEMYESSAKFSTTIPKPKRDKMVQTALDEGIAPTSRGVAKLDDAIDAIDGQIESLISEATDAGGRVPADAVFSTLGELRNKLGSATQTDGMGNIQKINDTARAIGENQRRLGKEFYTVEELQQLKRNLYKSANFDLKQGKADPAVNQARKDIARRSKELVEEQVPQVGELNRRYGNLVELQEPLTRSANRIDNRNFVSINQPLNTGIGYGLLDMPGAIAASTLTALGNPKVKPHIAIWLNKLKNQGLLSQMTDNSLVPALMRQGLLQSGRVSDQKTTR